MRGLRSLRTKMFLTILLVALAPLTAALWFMTTTPERLLLQAAVIAGAVALLASAILAWLLSRLRIAPLTRLASAARAIAGGERIEIPRVGSGDELEDLSRSLSAMVDALTEQTTRVTLEQDRTSRVVETMAEGLVIMDLGGEIVFANTSAERILGLPRQVIAQRTFHDPAWNTEPAPGQAIRSVEKLLQQLLETGEPVHGVEFSIERGDGERRNISVNAAFLPDAEGSVKVVATFDDITEHKRAEEARSQLAYEQMARLAAESAHWRVEALYDATRLLGQSLDVERTLAVVLDALRQLLAAGRAAVHYRDDTGGFRCLARVGISAACSDAIARYATSTPAGSRLLASRAPVMVGDLTKAMQQAEAGEARETLARLFAAESVRAILALPMVQQGQVVGALTVYDSEPRRYTDEEVQIAGALAGQAAVAIENARLFATAQAREERVKLQSTALASAFDAVTITDRAGVITWVNPAFTRLTGYSMEEAVGQTPRLLNSGKHGPEFFQQLWETILAGKTWRGEIVNRRKDGGLYVDEATVTPLADEAGTITHFVSVRRDITPRKDAEAALARAQQQIIQQERLRALGQMASGIAHDFNNALAPIVGFTELLLARPGDLQDTAKVRGYLEIMSTSAQDAASVVSRLREFYRHREEDEVFLPVDLPSLVEQTIMLTQPKWQQQAQARGIMIVLETDVLEVPPVAGNEAHLRQALTNLIFNAVDAMPEGGTITVRTRVDGDQVMLEVRDTGTGMTEEVRRRCLEPFFSTKGERGTGLGLSMVYGIVQRHEGTIAIESEWGKGTTFAIRLPLRNVDRTTGKAEKGERSAGGLRVLVVDDDALVRQVVAAYLETEQHIVETASNGREGLERFRSGRFDLVVTDLAMPELNGDQMAAFIKQVAPAMPVILLTGFGDLMKAADEKPEHVDTVMAKPVTLAALRQGIAQVMPRV